MVISPPYAPRDAQPPCSPVTEAPSAGARVGPYRVERLLGRGGMGEVWLAHDEALDRPVALKLIAAAVASDPERRLRFLEETRLAASLDHPHIVPIYASGDADGRLYLAMRYVEGDDLEGIVAAGGPLDAGRVLGLLRGIADALDAAHARGLVHRDVKPGNILVTRTAAGEHAYLTDFGLARRLTGGTSLDGGRLVGSLGYVAPELIDGLPADGRADVYSLGCTIYAALAGASPFARETEPATLLAHLDSHAKPLAERDAALAPLDAVLARALARDPADRPASAGDLVRDAADAMGQARAAWTVTAGKADIPLPYVGLRAFEETDARFFVGREEEVDQLLGRLRGDRFLAVFGPSGSGKSSLVRAGLVPALRAGRIQGSAAWPIAVVRPGALPLEALATRLLAFTPGPSMAATVDALAGDPRTLHLATELALGDAPPDARLVWVVDQAEELFTLVADEATRTAAIANLAHAATVPGGRTLVILAMRADFYHRCAAYPELAALVSASQALVSPMSAAQLERTIVEPAKLVGLELEPGLVETILDDVVDRPGALPLLEHLLFELWDRRRGATLTLAGYRECGGIEGAIAVRAETTYGGLSESDQAVARRVFLRLVQPGEGTEDTRRRATIRELGAGSVPVVEALAAARLLTLDTDDVERAPVVDVAHEALLRAWPRLRGWIDEDREALRTSRRIAEAAAEWQRLGRERDALLVGARLAEADEFLRDHATLLAEDERAYVEASLSDRERRSRDARRRQRVVVGVSLGLAVFFLALSVVAFSSWRATDEARNAALDLQQQADEQAAAAESAREDAEARRAEAEAERVTSLTRQLIAQSLQHDDDPLLANLLAVAAATVTGPETETDARQNVLTAVNLTPAVSSRVPLVPAGDDGSIGELRATPDGSRIAAVISTSDDRPPELSVWDVDPGVRGPQVVFGPEPVAGNAGFGLSPDGTRLVYVDPDGTITAVELASGATITAEGQVDPESSTQARFDSDGTTVRWLTEEPGNVAVAWRWSLVDGSVTPVRVRPTAGSKASNYTTLLGPDGRYLIRIGIVETPGTDGEPVVSVTGEIFDGVTGDRVATRYPIGMGRDGKSLVDAVDTDEGRVLTVRRLPSLEPVGHQIVLDPDMADGGPSVLADVDRDRVYVRTQDALAVYRLSDGESLSRVELPDHDPELASVTTDGRLLIGERAGVSVVDPGRLSPVEQSGSQALPFEARGTLTLLSADGHTLTSLPTDDEASTAAVQLDVAGGTPRTITVPGLAGGYDRYVLPDGNSIVQLLDSGRLVVTSLADGSRRELPEIDGMRDDLAEAEQLEQFPRLAVTQAGDYVAVATARRTVIAGLDGSVRSLDLVVPHRSARPLLLPGATEMVAGECDDGGTLLSRIDLGTGSVVDTLHLPGCVITMTSDAAGETALAATIGDGGFLLNVVDLPSFRAAGRIAIGEDPYAMRLVDNADGTRVAYVTTSGPDGYLRLRAFGLDDADALDAACASAGRNLTRAEWNQYLGDVPYVAVCPAYPADN